MDGGEALSRVPGTIPITDSDYLPSCFARISLSDGEGLAQYAKFLSRLDARPYLGHIRAPALRMAPSNSAATTAEEWRKLAQGIPGARLEIVDVPGHEIYVTAADRCQAAFLDSIRRLYHCSVDY